MEINLSGKIALVTGSSRGIGSSIALALAESGATVAMHGNRNLAGATKLVSEVGGECRAFQANLENPEQCKNLVDDVLQKYGRIDVLVNNAGVALASPIEDDNDAFSQKWDIVNGVNLLAAAILAREFIKHVKVSGSSGRIINIASRAAFRGDTAEHLAYAASKGGLVALSRSIARAYGKDGITSFVIAPGFTRTDMAQEFIDTYGEAYAAKDIALSRLTEPGDIAPMIVLLASGLADHATGTTIDFNAGSYVH